MTALDVATPPDAFAVHALLDGCGGEVLLNDVPLAATGLERREISVHATPWVIDGANELRIVIHRTRRLELLPMGAVAVDREAGPVWAWGRVMAGHHADVAPDPARDPVLTELTWGPVDEAARVLPAVIAGRFIAAGRPRWAWQDAPVLDPDAAATRAEVLAFLRIIHGAFVRGDGAAVAAHMPTLAREGVHFGPSSQDLAAGVAGELAATASDPDYAIAPYDDADVVLRPIAGGRVLRALDRSGAPLVRSAPSMVEGFRFRLDVARIDGRLEIARLG